MNLRLSMVALGLFVAGCGADGGGAKGAREPMLSCEGLSRDDCSTSSGCYVEEANCITLCVDPNGTGECLSPCRDDFRCLPRPASCEALDEAACNADSRCEYVGYACDAMCRDDGHGGCLPCVVPPSSCRTRLPESCESLGQQACETDARCEYVQYACAAVCIDDGHGGCLPCNVPPSYCRTREPASCESLDAQACIADLRCELEDILCTTECRDDGQGGCLPCNASPSCRTRETPVSCYGLTPDVCDLHPECEFVSHGTCECNDDPACSCLAIEPSCQPRQPTSRCEGLSPQQCIDVPGCGLLEVACACPPNAACECDVPEPRCVNVNEPHPNPCAGLDLATCTTDARCEIGNLVCTTECRDDGQGGCLPCPDTAVCQLRAEEPVAGCGGGGTPPPAP